MENKEEGRKGKHGNGRGGKDTKREQKGRWKGKGEKEGKKRGREGHPPHNEILYPPLVPSHG